MRKFSSKNISIEAAKDYYGTLGVSKTADL
jgi:hypothetical protein